ncbi:hypothetical protein AB0M57_34285 [Streptomyces sp. NPDC051597]|uniref:hypothetical protein n=1 Tax=Streptomyces sp. NPDC051597 TaxID=3155049 RepID=UPI0034154605
MNEQCDAEMAPVPGGGTVVRAYTPYEVIAINLRVDGRAYRAVAMAPYDHPDGRRAYRLCLWPALPDGARTCWYWWDEQAMTRRDLRP